jgi:hypothetical protein
MTMVWAYSGRTLNSSADKLPVILRLVELWSKITCGVSYLAVLWHSHLPLGLLQLNELPFQQQDHAHRAPSWSWPSLNGSIAWHEHILTTVDTDFNVESSKVKLAHIETPYGALLSGSLPMFAIAL